MKIDHARLTDIEGLLQLYFSAYGRDYPVAHCTDPLAMSEAIKSERFLWLVGRHTDGTLIGSAIFEIEPLHRISRLTGVVTHTQHRGKKVATLLSKHGLDELLVHTDKVDSIYTTTRTLTIAPQRMCKNLGFIPLGIFPNSHRVRQYETMTLMAKFRDGFLKQRNPQLKIPERLVPIANVMNQQLGVSVEPIAIPRSEAWGEQVEERIALKTQPGRIAVEPTSELDFEIISAPQFVQRRFDEIFSDPYERFFPFHPPNMLAASTNGEVEIFAHFSRKDQYCTIVSLTKPIYTLGSRLRGLLSRVRDYGISYIEILIGIQHSKSIEVLSDAHFLPSAIYPSMMRHEGKPLDFVLMTRTMEPLNFTGMKIDECFKPFVDLYVRQWTKMHLETLEVAPERE